MAINYAENLAGMTLPYHQLRLKEQKEKETQADRDVAIAAIRELIDLRKAYVEKKWLGKLDEDGKPMYEYKDTSSEFGPTERLFKELGTAMFPTAKSFKPTGITEPERGVSTEWWDQNWMGSSMIPGVQEDETEEQWSERYKQWQYETTDKPEGKWRPGRGLDVAMDYIGKKVSGIFQ